MIKECPIPTKTPKRTLNRITVHRNICLLLTQNPLEGIGLMVNVAINNNHCTPLHAHIGNENKGFHKVMEAIIT